VVGAGFRVFGACGVRSECGVLDACGVCGVCDTYSARGVRIARTGLLALALALVLVLVPALAPAPTLVLVRVPDIVAALIRSPRAQRRRS
jgi:hypothetical protein